MNLPSDLKAKVLASVQATPAPPRPPWWKVAFWIVPMSAAIMFSLFTAVGGMQHGEGRPTWMLVGTFIGWLTVAVLATWGAFGRGRSAVGRARTVLGVIALATPAVLFASTLVWNAIYPEAAGWWEGRLGLKCLGLSLAMAVWPLVGMMLVRRASNPVHPGITGAALGAASGAWAGVVVDLWCPVSHPAHIAIGHILPIVILALAGLVIGRRVMAIRGR
jgi:hypothetical protein